MGVLNNFFKNQQIKKFANEISTFQKYHHYMQVALYKEIADRLQSTSTLCEEDVKRLSAQIINYYSGYDVNEQLKNIQEPNKSSIEKIKHLIIPTAEDLLASNHSLKQLIVYTLRMDIVYECATKGEDYLNSNEYNNKYKILAKYGSEFPEEANPQLYYKIFADYFKVRI